MLILFLAVFAGIAAIVVLIPGLFLIGLGGLRRKKHDRYWVPSAFPGTFPVTVGAIAVALAMACAGIVVVAVLLFVVQTTPSEGHGERARAEVARTLHIEPSPDVQDAHSFTAIFDDNGEQRMRFEAAPSTVARILAEDFRPVDCEAFDHSSGMFRHPLPTWWVPPTQARRCYRSDQWATSFRRSYALLCVSLDQRVVYFRSYGSN